MSSRELFPALVLCTPLIATGAPALEKSPARVPSDLNRSSWNACVTTCSVTYYNYCTGWTWVWSNLEPDARFGVWYQTDGISDVPGRLRASWQLASGAPSGYGYTGTLSVHLADEGGCPIEPPLFSQAWLPSATPSWFGVSLGGTEIPLGEPGWVLLATIGSAPGNPTTLYTDRPSAGPTGPAACGTCYPTTRVGHSFCYGTTSAPECPGVRLTDGACSAELAWVVEGTIVECTSCSVVTGVDASLEPSSWARVKALYRD